MSFLKENMNDWQYLSVRRKMEFLLQSCKIAAHSYVFESNNKNTWTSIKVAISSFLTNVWKEGGLCGQKTSNAFKVEYGLGTTMTEEDIKKALIKVNVKVAIEYPDEFIILSFQQGQISYRLKLKIS